MRGIGDKILNAAACERSNGVTRFSVNDEKRGWPMGEGLFSATVHLSKLKCVDTRSGGLSLREDVDSVKIVPCGTRSVRRSGRTELAAGWCISLFSDTMDYVLSSKRVSKRLWVMMSMCLARNTIKSFIIVQCELS